MAATSDGFGAKNRAWNSKELLNEWRGDWAHAQNLALALAGSRSQVDHRSYRERGLGLTPTKHLGVVGSRQGADSKAMVQGGGWLDRYSGI